MEMNEIAVQKCSLGGFFFAGFCLFATIASLGSLLLAVTRAMTTSRLSYLYSLPSSRVLLSQEIYLE